MSVAPISLLRPVLRSLRAQTALVIAVVAIALVAGLCGLFASVLEAQIHRDKGAALAAIARSIAMNLSLGMQAQRRQVVQLAESEELWEHGLDDQRVSRALTRIRASRPYAAWLGVADEQGVVRAAADDVLVGKDVTQRPWFKAGIGSVFVGDVHGAKLLAAFLPKSASGEPPRLVDFAAPIRRDGRVVGVVAMHGNWDWAGSVVASVLRSGTEQGLEVLILGDSAEVLFASREDLKLPPESLQQIQAALFPAVACDGCPEGTMVAGADGKSYLSAGSGLPTGDSASLGLGWRVVVRQPTAVAYAEIRRSTTLAFVAGTCAVLIAALAAWFASGALSTPLVRLSRAAEAVERGEPGASIPRLAPNVEVEGLSTSLSAMTNRLLRSNEELEIRVAQRTAELNRSHAELERINLEQHAMLNNDLVAIVRVRERVVVWVNRATERMFGYTADELIGSSTQTLHVDEASWTRTGAEAYASLNAHGRYSGQAEMRRRNGDPLWVELSATRLPQETGETLFLMTDITAMKAHQLQVEHIAFHDALTGLANRLLLADRLKHALGINERLGQRVAVCCIDLDGFKAVNDQMGHGAGDEVLREVARRLQACVRNSDTVARLGGDEFVLVLAPFVQTEDCMHVLERVVASVRQPVALTDGSQARVSASIGVAFSPDHHTVAGRLLKMADEAMYVAKRKGKNGVCVYAPDRTADALPTDLHEAA